MMTTNMTRRSVLAANAAVLVAGQATATIAEPPVAEAAIRSPWLCNGVTVAPDGTVFLGLPRFAGHMDTPSLAKVGRDGAPVPFPGDAWNRWQPGVDGREAFVMVNAVHVFADGTLWVVDQGTADGRVVPGAAKLVRLDPKTGAVLATIRFGADILPPGATMNDMRLHDNIVYVTDSGLGGILVHDLGAGRTLRRLSHHPLLRQEAGMAQKGYGGRPLAGDTGQRPQVHSDMIELDADGAWLYWSTPTGPIRRIATELLLDERMDDAALARAIQTVATIPTIGGTAMDTLGNIYLADAENRRIAVLTPQGRMLSLVEDERLVSPDALFIDAHRRLHVPAAQLERLAQHAGGKDRTQAPWEVLSFALPATLDGVALGDAVTGATPKRGLVDIRGIEHVAMTVPDMEAGIRFCTEAFGATVLYRHLTRDQPPMTAEQAGPLNGLPAGATMRAMCLLRLGNGANIELFEIEGRRREEAANINDVGLVHFCIAVDDVAAAAARFERAGGQMIAGPHDLGSNEEGPGNRFHFGRMPWGTWIEFATLPAPLSFDPGATQARWTPPG